MTGKTADKSSRPPRATSPLSRKSDDQRRVFKDVWSRSGSRYRIRAIILLAVNALLFAGVGSFAFWLRRGERFAPMADGYLDEFRETFLSVGVMGYSGVSLGNLLLEPISVQEVPLQIPIVGLLMAALIAIPILVSILYRFWSALPFIAVVGFLAVMPWLAITLLISCAVASFRVFQTRYRFVSALLGLLPAVVYLILAWAGTTDDMVGAIDPMDRIKFVAPWVLAIVAAAVAFAVVLTIAKVVDYRPGAIAPLLAVMLGLPVALFERYVGRDELYYRLLEQANQAHFMDVDASLPYEQAFDEEWSRRSTLTSKQAVRESMETRWLFSFVSDFGLVLAEHQVELTTPCDQFLREFPRSRYAPNVLYIKARALDMRVDLGEFKRTKWIRYYDSFPNGASEPTWDMLWENFEDSELALVALLRLAQLEAREGEVERAIGKLRIVLERFEEDLQTNAGASALDDPLQGLLTRDHPEATLEIPHERILLEAHRLYDLLTQNRDPIYVYEPLSGKRHTTDTFRYGLLDLVPRYDAYLASLQELRDRYPDCQLADNIDLEIAKATTESERMIERLKACLKRYPDGDAVPEALFRLAVGYKEASQVGRGEETFARLFRDFPDSIWTRQASRYAHGSPSAYISEAGS